MAEFEVGCVFGFLLGVFIFVFLMPMISEKNINQISAENFCQSWAKENNLEYNGADWYEPLFQSNVCSITCEYYENVERFDGGISTGELLRKHFEISKTDLLKWVGENNGDY